MNTKIKVSEKDYIVPMYYCIEFIFTIFGLFIGISLKLLGAKKRTNYFLFVMVSG